MHIYATTLALFHRIHSIKTYGVIRFNSITQNKLTVHSTKNTTIRTNIST